MYVYIYTYIHIYIYILNPLKSELLTKQACRDELVVYSVGGVTSHMEVIKQAFSTLAKQNVNYKLNGPKCQVCKTQVK